MRSRIVALSVLAFGCSVGGTGPIDGSLLSPDAGMTGDFDAGQFIEPDSGPLPEGCTEEDCENGYDDDCDGMVNDGCPCLPGEMRSCYRGRPETEGHGACAAGTMVCGEGLEFGTWGECAGDVMPGEESCDVAENDEDCDGAANEGCECTGSEPLPCGSDVGECGAGVQECVDGLRGECNGSMGPEPEECNGVDDDCDGTSDEELVRGCGSDVGECYAGTETCIAGAWDACSGSQGPIDEVCDGLDNDCDGASDEELVRDCGSTVGACLPGTQRCVSAAWGACEGETVATLEDCNSVDDDCDGMVDEGLTRQCGISRGICTTGTESCSGGTWSACIGAIPPGVEACDGVLDEDCDGTVDDGCGCVTGRTRPCGSDVGECSAGTETCRTDGTWGTCTGATTGTSETCDNLDNDCDGSTDEMLSRQCGATDVGRCAFGTQTCASGSWGACAGEVTAIAERCDGTVDDDCDGVVDDGCNCTTGTMQSCGIDTGECSFGTQTCDATGNWGACTGGQGPRAETCNNRDDDCDGMRDEMLVQQCGTDVGRCELGSQVCSMGSWGACMGGITSSPEVCEGLVDEDCDGTVDDGCGCTNGTNRPCGVDTGECSFGSQTCTTGMWGTCTGGTGPVAETCDNRDNDCDGAIDDMVTRSCGTDTGACRVGTQTCTAGAWGTACVGEIAPVAERCDGSVDDDCDGVVDDGCNCTTGTMQSCGISTGECSFGSQTCDATGNWGACTGGTGPAAEICDNRDNDCDGTTDEMLSRQCGTTDVGRCEYGTQTCAAGAWGACGGTYVGPSTELCDGAVDEDCDGLRDEGCACINGATQPCGISTGACNPGSQTCNLMGMWGACGGAGYVGPTTEICNGIDDDCDGMTDEGACGPPVVMCPAGMTAQVLTNVTLSGTASDPDGGTVTYMWSVTSRPIGSTAQPATPTSRTTTFFLDAAGTYTLRFCATDDEGQSACCDVTITSTAPGTLHVELQWNTAYGDADLHLRDVSWTSGQGWWTVDDCHWRNRSPDWGGPGGSGNPNLDRDDTNGYGPENITINTNPAVGTYRVAVHYYCDQSLPSGMGRGNGEPCCAPGSGPTTATVRVYCGGVLRWSNSSITLRDPDDWVNVADINYLGMGMCNVTAVNSTTTGAMTLPPGLTGVPACML